MNEWMMYYYYLHCSWIISAICTIIHLFTLLSQTFPLRAVLYAAVSFLCSCCALLQWIDMEISSPTVNPFIFSILRYSAFTSHFPVCRNDFSVVADVTVSSYHIYIYQVLVCLLLFWFFIPRKCSTSWW